MKLDLEKFGRRLITRRINYYPCKNKEVSNVLLELISNFINEQKLSKIGYIDSNMLKNINFNDLLVDFKSIDLKHPSKKISKLNNYSDYVSQLREFTMVEILIIEADGITTDGEILFNDEIGNKIAGAVFGPKRVIILVDKKNIYNNIDEYLEVKEDNVNSIIYGSMEGHKDRIYLIHNI